MWIGFAGVGAGADIYRFNIVCDYSTRYIVELLQEFFKPQFQTQRLPG